MKRKDVNSMLNSIDDKLAIEAISKKDFPKKRSTIKKLGLLGSMAACLCIVSGLLYFTLNQSKTKYITGIRIPCDGFCLYYEEQPNSIIDDLELRYKKGDKITKFCHDNVNYYQLKDFDDIKNIIQDDGKDITEWYFVNYSIEEEGTLDMHWLLENVFSISSGNDIIDIIVNGETFKINEEDKEKLYNDLLSIHVPHTDEEHIMLAGIYERSDLIKINIKTKSRTLNFVFHPNNRILKIDERGVYSLFTILSENYLSNS